MPIIGQLSALWLLVLYLSAALLVNAKVAETKKSFFRTALDKFESGLEAIHHVAIFEGEEDDEPPEDYVPIKQRFTDFTHSAMTKEKLLEEIAELCPTTLCQDGTLLERKWAKLVADGSVRLEQLWQDGEDVKRFEAHIFYNDEKKECTITGRIETMDSKNKEPAPQ
jgi:hypothetical protein